MTYGKRGQILERMIQHSNNVYRRKGIALVDKVPTPWNVHYDRRTGRVHNAFPEKKSTVDFIGVSHGRSIAFEAKSTKVRTRFDLSNFEEHQINYLVQHQDQGGISFAVVHFDKHNETYFLTIDDLNEWWVGSMRGERKSIPYDWFVVNCDLIRSRNGIVLDYIRHCRVEKESKNMK